MDKNYHTLKYWNCEFEFRSGRSAQYHVIKFVSDLRQVGGFLRVLQFPPPINWPPQHNRNIVESGVKHHHKHTIKKNIILWVESAARVYTHLLFIGSNKYIHLAYSIISQLYYFNTVKKKRRKEIINRFIVDNKNWSSNGQHHNQLQHEPFLWLPLQTPKPNRK
jgi:hypothetical protein